MIAAGLSPVLSIIPKDNYIIMGEPVHGERTPVSSGPETEGSGVGAMLSPPAFQLKAEGGLLQRKDAPMQFSGDYTRVNEAFNNVLGIADAAGAVAAPDPRTWESRIPGSCRTALWNVHKALHWEASYGRTAREWARYALENVTSLVSELDANGVPGQSLVRRVGNAIAPFLNPESGSQGGDGLEAALTRVLNSNMFAGPRDARATRAASRLTRTATQMQTVLVAAADVLSDELSASVPGQVLNAATPYNYHFHEGRGFSTGHLNGIKALYRARWEVATASQRRSKITYARDALATLLQASTYRDVLSTLNTYAEPELTAKVTEIDGLVQRYIRARMDAVSADTTLTPIARNGAAAPVRAARSGGGSLVPSAAAIVYDDGVTPAAWDPSGTTVEQARTQLGDSPRRTLAGANIGAYEARSHHYPYVRASRAFNIIVNTDNRNYGIKYGGLSGLTFRAIDELVAQDPPVFNADQLTIIRATRPHVSSEGPISSINTYDNQDITIAGRGERSERVTTLIDMAIDLQGLIGLSITADLEQVRAKVKALKGPSTKGTAGPRLNVVDIEELVVLLERPDIHKAMTLAKLNDSILTFSGVRLRDAAPRRGGRPVLDANGEEVRGRTRRFDRDLSGTPERQVAEAFGTHHVHPVIVGIATHNALGEPGFFSNPVEYAIRASREFPERFRGEEHDFRQLSKQVAFLMKIRMQNKWNDHGGAPSVNANYFRIFPQKIADFETYFTQNRVANPGSGFFDMAAATEVLPFWTAPRTYTATTTRPGEGTLYLRNGGSYYVMGNLLPGSVTSLTRRPDTSGEVEADSSEEETGGED